MTDIFGSLDLSRMNIPVTVALAAVATIGYFVGRMKRNQATGPVAQSRRELRRAQSVASDLEKITLAVRKSLSLHCTSVSKFRERLSRLGSSHDEEASKELYSEVEEILKQTLHLATQIANAHDDIRRQSVQLMAFTEARTDPLTGVKNRRGLHDALDAQLAFLARYKTPFTVAIIDVDHFKEMNDEQGHLFGDNILQGIARLMDETVRETDIVARYGGDEFVIIMPQTDPEGAGTYCERLRGKVEQQFPVTISVGIAAGNSSDNQESLLTRADSALYQAKAAGRNQIFLHHGSTISPAEREEPVAV